MESFDVFDKLMGLLNTVVMVLLVLIIINKPESTKIFIDTLMSQFDNPMHKLIFILFFDLVLVLNFIRIGLGFYYDWKDKQEKNRMKLF